MSISRLVLQSPFDIPSKPRAQFNNGDVNRSVRRSTFNPRVGTETTNRGSAQSEREQYVLFDRRLIHRSIFASPLGIDVKENKDATNVVMQKSPPKKKRVFKPKVAKDQRSVQTGGDFNARAVHDQIQYVDSSAQTEICCSLEDIVNDVMSDYDLSESPEEMTLSHNDQEMSEQLDESINKQ